MILKRNIVLQKGLRLADPSTEKNKIVEEKSGLGELMRDTPLTEVLLRDGVININEFTEHYYYGI